MVGDQVKSLVTGHLACQGQNSKTEQRQVDPRVLVARGSHVSTGRGQVGPRTRRNARAYQLLSSVMKEAVDDELIEVSPCHLKGASKPRPRHSAATVEALSVDQTLIYMRAVPQHCRVALMVAAWCELRSGEVRIKAESPISEACEDSRDEQVLHTLRQGVIEQDVGGHDERVELGGGRHCVC